MEEEMDAKVTWQSGMAFNGMTESGFAIPLDASVDHGGSGSGAAPMELILVGLVGCTAMDVISILQKKRQQVTKFEILLHGDRATDHPKVFTDITVEFVVTGHNLDPESVQRAVELSEGKYCSVNGMFKKSVNVTTKCTVLEA
jgi:putative redox protein